MSAKDELLAKYDGANQDTKRAIIEFLWRYPESEHDPAAVFETVKHQCRATSVETVKNNLSELVDEEAIRHETRSFYQWAGEGRDRPVSRLQDVSRSLRRWIMALDLSKGSLLIVFMIWSVGIVFSVASLIALFAPSESLLGVSFIQWFVVSGTLMICSSAVVMVWVPIYAIDVLRAKSR